MTDSASPPEANRTTFLPSGQRVVRDLEYHPHPILSTSWIDDIPGQQQEDRLRN